MTNNELIAEFMGHSTYAFADSKTYFQDPVKREMFGDPMLERLSIKLDLKYHDSWDWLMPVVDKINGMGYDVLILGNGIKTLTHSCEITSTSAVYAAKAGDSLHETVYKAVVEFIKWYNQNK